MKIEYGYKPIRPERSMRLEIVEPTRMERFVWFMTGWPLFLVLIIASSAAATVAGHLAGWPVIAFFVGFPLGAAAFISTIGKRIL